MGIQNIIPSVMNAAKPYGKHKIPRFIYHLTTPEKYEKILKDGVIRPSGDDFFGEGVFALDLTNFFKCWGRNDAWRNKNLISRLVEHVAEFGKRLCIVKIPTEKLNTDVLVIRSQNRLFQPLAKANISSSDKQKLNDYVKDQCSKGASEQDAFILALEKFCPEAADHIEFGTPAKFSGLFKQRKEAFEYIYPDEIPASCTEKIGEVYISELKQSNDYDINKPLRSIFESLLKGTPERKNTKFLNE